MVKRTLSLWPYLLKSHALFLSLPALACIMIWLVRDNDSLSAVNLMGYLGFWMVCFPAAAVSSPLGSLHQKELILSLPISPVSFAFVQPLIGGLIYGLMIAGTFYASAAGHISADLRIPAAQSLLISAMFLSCLTSLLINFFKNAGVGLCLSIIYVIFGIFTTGTGQGPFYLSQWFRPRGQLPPDAYSAYLLFGIVLLCILNYVVIKKRSKFQWIPF